MSDMPVVLNVQIKIQWTCPECGIRLVEFLALKDGDEVVNKQHEGCPIEWFSLHVHYPEVTVDWR